MVVVAIELGALGVRERVFDREWIDAQSLGVGQ